MEFAVGASESAMSSLLGKLGGLLAQEYTLISDVRGEIQYIHDELASMHAFLRSLAGAGEDAHDEQTKGWVEQVRDVAYDIEDCIDDFSHRIGAQPRGDGPLAALRRAWYAMATLWARRGVAAKIVDLKNRAHDVGERRSRYGVKDPDQDAAGEAKKTPASYKAADRPQPPPQLVGAAEPVGMEDTMAKLEPWLTGGEGAMRILAVVGFGGLGKTTLALALQRRFGERFDCRASVQASQRINLPSLLRGILRQVMPQDTEQKARKSGGSDSHLDAIEGWSEKQLRDKLTAHLEKKRYFLLIDDVWSVSAWDSIWVCLPHTNGSSIVVTTRFKSVAEASCRQQEGRVEILEKLPDEKSKILFFERIFGGNDPSPDQYKDIKEQILKKCGGLPLAIVSVAGLLARGDRKEKSHWTKVLSSLGSELEKNLTPEGVTQILNLCYNDLPADQKKCLQYLSIFPKGCTINRKRLIRRWIAEGFMSEKHGKTVEEVAEDYFNEIISRNVVRPVDHSSNGKVKTCQVHDMILEYILSKSSKENFITVVGGHWVTPMPSNKVRRLSLHNSDPDHAKAAIESMNLSHVRSLTAFDNLDRLHSFSFKFRILQVLDLEGCKGLNSRQLHKICKMFYLKYLSLRKAHIKELPSNIGRLRYLETLDIRDTNVRELPSSAMRLQHMAHLLAGNKCTRLALKFNEDIAKMIALQTLSGIEITKSSTAALADMQNLTKLKKLSIYNMKDYVNSNQKYADLISSIDHLSGYALKSLAIDDSFTGFLELVISMSTPPKYIHSLELSGKLPQVPEWIIQVKDLEKLTLSLTSLGTKGLHVLSQLPSLFSLTFSFNAENQARSLIETLEKNTMDTGGMIFVQAGGFNSLKLLRFSAPIVPQLNFLEGAMPELQRVELRFRVFEGAYGVENLKGLRQVLVRVSQKASETTKEKVLDIKRSVGMHWNKPTVVVDECYEVDQS